MLEDEMWLRLERLEDLESLECREVRESEVCEEACDVDVMDPEGMEMESTGGMCWERVEAMVELVSELGRDLIEGDWSMDGMVWRSVADAWNTPWSHWIPYDHIWLVES